MKYSREQAARLARQIRDRFGEKIAHAADGTPVPPKFVAGLIGVEAGKDAKGYLRENATRFEPHVYEKLKSVQEGKLLQYNKIRPAQLADATDGALRNLATSFGLCQVMGWWSLHLGCTVAELRDPETHLDYAVKLMALNSRGDFEREEYVGEFKQWNSGSETGKTHDPDYVHNASAVMDAYAELGDVEIKEPEPAKAEPQKEPEPAVTTVPSHPPVIEVKTQKVSWTTKVAAVLGPVGTFFTTIGLKVGGVQFTQSVILALIAAYIVTVIVGAWLYNEGKKRADRRQEHGMNNLADPHRANVVAGNGA